MTTRKVLSTAVSVATILAALYIGYKNRNKEGFWFGVLALALLGTYFEFNSPNFTFKTGAPKNEIV